MSYRTPPTPAHTTNIAVSKTNLGGKREGRIASYRGSCALSVCHEKETGYKANELQKLLDGVTICCPAVRYVQLSLIVNSVISLYSSLSM